MLWVDTDSYMHRKQSSKGLLLVLASQPIMCQKARAPRTGRCPKTPAGPNRTAQQNCRNSTMLASQTQQVCMLLQGKVHACTVMTAKTVPPHKLCSQLDCSWGAATVAAGNMHTCQQTIPMPAAHSWTAAAAVVAAWSTNTLTLPGKAPSLVRVTTRPRGLWIVRFMADEVKINSPQTCAVNFYAW